MTPQFHARPADGPVVARLEAEGLHPVLARLAASRGIDTRDDLDTTLARLHPPSQLLHAEAMASILADAIAAGRRLLIVGDYDADGATASAVGALALGRFGAKVETLVPNRFDYGYGLTPEIVRVAAERKPDFIVTVDNGIASLDGVAEARKRGIPVLVTDHHLPGSELPDALAIVNPNQPGCTFPSKHLAGVGVMFYVMLALRTELRRRGAFATRPEPNLAELLDLVALGTVADVVKLDRNNRVLVAQGLERIRRGLARPGILALMRAAGREPSRASPYDLGFVVGPRLNAAGRLEDMSQGIACLLADDVETAADLATRLDSLNRERREIEADMQASALASLEKTDPGNGCSIVMFDPDWHQGVVGLLASRLKDRYHRPTICLAAGPDGTLKGSGRSIPALHLRDALDLVDRRNPGLIPKFGGHAAAAGLSLKADDVERFRAAFEATVAGLVTPADLARTVETDGPLHDRHLDLDTADLLARQVWGQGFPPPLFEDDFEVREQRTVGDGRHRKLTLRRVGGRDDIAAMRFNEPEPLPERIRAAYRIEANEWRGNRSLQLMVEHWQVASIP
jgi:single-stranded-DNA-specific exonuclease